MMSLNGQRPALQSGFTLVEMMTSVVIVSLLLAAISPAVGGFTVKAKLASTKMNCRVVQSILVGYGTDHNGEIPTARVQYVASSTYRSLANPFDVTQRGIGSWGSTQGVSAEDNAHQQAPVAIWNVDPQDVALINVAGVILYVPYRTASEAQAGGNSLPLGGDDGSNGYTLYTIEAMAILDLSNPISVPYADSRITNWS